MNKAIIVSTKVIGHHYWPDAPLEVEFLRFSHRHEFHIKVCVPVDESDREREFFIEQRQLRTNLDIAFITNNHGEYLFGTRSCEHIAEILMEMYDYQMVEVMEDGENGALLWK